MEIELERLLRENPILLTFVVIGLGLLVGELRIAGVSVGATAGVLLVGLVLGHLGFPDRPEAATFGFGMVAGLLLGLVVVKIGGISIGLGSAGGLLLVGILVGFVGSINPTLRLMPTPARSFLMDFGLVLFMAEVGLKAGAGAALTSVGPALIAEGALVTLAPVGVGYAVGRYALGLNPALLLGSITGAMTNTASLNAITELAKSPVPALGYAGTYTFSNVLLTFAGTLLMML